MDTENIAYGKPHDYVWADYFYLDESCETGLRWAVAVGSGRKGTTFKTAVGQVTSTASCSGYYKVQVNRRKFCVHRVIWEMLNGAIPENYVINHKDGNGLNNSYDNLECVPQAVNCRNAKMTTLNTSGITGVNFVSHKGSDFWCAQWCTLEGVKKSKWFGVKKFGYDGAKELATQFRLAKIEELNELGGNYSSRHGGKE